jgi:hypothetical protein
MDAFVKIPEVCLEVYRIIFLQYPVEAGAGGLHQTEETRSQDIDGHVIQEPDQCYSRVPVHGVPYEACTCDTASRLCVQTVVCWSTLPLRSTLSSKFLAASFGGFPATMSCRTIRTSETSFIVPIVGDEDVSNDRSRTRRTAQAQGAATC